MESEWPTVLLGDEAELITGYPFKSSQYTENPDGIKLVRGDNVVQGCFRWDGVKRWPTELADGLENYRLIAGDVVLAMDRPWIEAGLKYAEISSHDLPALLVQRVSRLRGKSRLNTRFLKYLIGSPYFTNHVLAVQTGTAVPHISGSQIKEFTFRLPPLPEQKAIAHILGSLDDKIELNRRMNASLEGMAQALFRSWFVDFDPVIDNALAAGNPIPDELAERADIRSQALADGTANRQAAQAFPAAFQFSEELGWIPEEWEVATFGDVSVCTDSKRIPLSKRQREEKKPGNIPYYGATSIMDYINDWIFDDTYLLIGEDGSVAKEDGSPFVQYIWGKSWVNNHAHVLQGKSGISTEHLMLFMLSQNITAYVTGAVQQKINQKNMNSIPFLKADDEVNQQFASSISPFYERLKLLTEENKTLAALRDTLLPKLISGELRIPDAERLAEEALA